MGSGKIQRSKLFLSPRCIRGRGGYSFSLSANHSGRSSFLAALRFDMHACGGRSLKLGVFLTLSGLLGFCRLRVVSGSEEGRGIGQGFVSCGQESLGRPAFEMCMWRS